MKSRRDIPGPAFDLSVPCRFEHCEPRGRAAVEKLRPTLLAMDPTAVKRVNVDVPVAVSHVLGALPRVAAYRARISVRPDALFSAGKLRSKHLGGPMLRRDSGAPEPFDQLPRVVRDRRGLVGTSGVHKEVRSQLDIQDDVGRPVLVVRE